MFKASKLKLSYMYFSAWAVHVVIWITSGLVSHTTWNLFVWPHSTNTTWTPTHVLNVCRVAGLCKDYCGVLNEEAIRLNFVLIYELLDEVMVSVCTYRYTPYMPLMLYPSKLCRTLGILKEHQLRFWNHTFVIALVLFHTTQRVEFKDHRVPAPCPVMRPTSQLLLP